MCCNIALLLPLISKVLVDSRRFWLTITQLRRCGSLVLASSEIPFKLYCDDFVHANNNARKSSRSCRAKSGDPVALVLLRLCSCSRDRVGLPLLISAGAAYGWKRTYVGLKHSEQPASDLTAARSNRVPVTNSGLPSPWHTQAFFVGLGGRRWSTYYFKFGEPNKRSRKIAPSGNK